MLFNKRSLETIAVFAGDNNVRHILNGIHMLSNGTMVATDSVMLGILSHQGGKASDFPASKDKEAVNEFVGEGDGAQEPKLQPCTLAIDGMKQVAKAIPRKKRLAILANAHLGHVSTNGGKSAKFRVTDLDNEQIINVQKLEGHFPQYEQVIPKDPPVYRVCIGASLLKRLADAAEKLAGGKDEPDPMIELEFFKNGRGPIRAFVSNNDAQVLQAILMPMKGKRSSDEYGILPTKEKAVA